jgi:hypothetical protein
MSMNKFEFHALHRPLLGVVASVTFIRFCYTRFADTLQEMNSLLTADRRPTIAPSRIDGATRKVAP